MIPLEFALFAVNVTVSIRNEVDAILSTIKPEFARATSNEAFMIALALQIIKVNFNWKCIEPADAPDNFNLCTNYELLLA